MLLLANKFNILCVCVCCRHVCEILQVHSPHSSTNGAQSANGHTKPAASDAIVISDSDDEGKAFQSPAAQINGSVGQRSPVICDVNSAGQRAYVTSQTC